MKERAYAKINLCLDVVGQREDGYHELKMIMEHISPKARKLIQTIFARAKAREEKIRSRKKGKRHERSRAA